MLLKLKIETLSLDRLYRAPMELKRGLGLKRYIMHPISPPPLFTDNSVINNNCKLTVQSHSSIMRIKYYQQEFRGSFKYSV